MRTTTSIIIGFAVGVTISVMIVFTSKPRSAQNSGHGNEAGASSPLLIPSSEPDSRQMVSSTSEDPVIFLSNLFEIPFGPGLEEQVASAARNLKGSMAEVIAILNRISAGPWRAIAWEAYITANHQDLGLEETLHLITQASTREVDLYQAVFSNSSPGDAPTIINFFFFDQKRLDVLERYLQSLLASKPQLASELTAALPPAAAGSNLVKYRFLMDYVSSAADKGSALTAAFDSIASAGNTLEWKATYAATATNNGDPDAVNAVILHAGQLPPVEKNRLLSVVGIHALSLDQLKAVVSAMTSPELQSQTLERWQAANQ